MDYRGRQQIQWQLDLHGDRLNDTDRALLELWLSPHFESIGKIAKVMRMQPMVVKFRLEKSIDRLW